MLLAEKITITKIKNHNRMLYHTAALRDRSGKNHHVSSNNHRSRLPWSQDKWLVVAVVMASVVIFTACFSGLPGEVTTPEPREVPRQATGNIYAPPTPGNNSLQLLFDGNRSIENYFKKNGSGTGWDSAYVITNYNVLASNNFSILIKNTSACIAIVNCTIASTESLNGRGIVVSNASNVRIQGCTIVNQRVGIVLDGVVNVTITSCNISCIETDIAAHDLSHGVTIFGNAFSQSSVENSTSFAPITSDGASTGTDVALDDGLSGNYWQGYAAAHPAATLDGTVLSESHFIAGFTDRFPLANPFVGDGIPVINGIMANTTVAYVGDPIGFTFAMTSSNNISRQLLAWDFDDDTQVSQNQSVVHAFLRPGSYTVTVTVGDVDGDLASKTCTVTIIAQPVKVSGPFVMYIIAIILAGIGISCMIAGKYMRKKTQGWAFIFNILFFCEFILVSMANAAPGEPGYVFPLAVSPSTGTTFRLTDNATITIPSTTAGRAIVMASQNGRLIHTEGITLPPIDGINLLLDPAFGFTNGTVDILVRKVRDHIIYCTYTDVYSTSIAVEKEEARVNFEIDPRKEYDYEGDKTYYSFKLNGHVIDNENVTIPGKIVSVWMYNESSHADQFVANCTAGRDGAFSHTFTRDQLYTSEVLFTCTVAGDAIYLPAVGHESCPVASILSDFDIIDQYVSETDSDTGPANNTCIHIPTHIYRIWDWGFGLQDFGGWTFTAVSGSPVIDILNASMVAGEFSGMDDFSGYFLSPGIYFGADECLNATIEVWYRGFQFQSGKTDILRDGDVYEMWLDIIDFEGNQVASSTLANGRVLGWKNATINATSAFQQHGYYYIRLWASVRPGTKQTWLDQRDFFGCLFDWCSINIYTTATQILEYGKSGHEWTDFQYLQRTASLTGTNVAP
nr:PKD domain-containing protein [Candidatus Sigynarchaeota archaeon]